MNTYHPSTPVLYRTHSPSEIFIDETVDAVIIATPAETHYDLTMQALEAGKHVLVEKPMAMTLDQAKRMYQAAEARGLTLMIGHVMLYHPGFTILARMIHKGELGQLMYLYSNRLNFGRVRQHENVIWSFAPHDISMVLSLLNELPREVDAWGGAYLGPVEDVTFMTMEFPFNVRAHMHVSWLNPFKEHRFVVVGRKKMAVLDDVAKTLTLYDQHMEPVHGYEPTPVNGGKTVVEIALCGVNEPLYREQQDFIRCIQTGATPIASAQNGIEVMQILEDAEKALQERAYVP